MTEPIDVTVRRMRPDEYPEMRAVSDEAFGPEDRIGDLLDALAESWAWQPELSFVAVVDGAIAGQVLYSSAILDAPVRLVDVLVLSPVGIRPDLHGRGVGSRLIRESLVEVEATRPEPLVFLEGSPRYYPRFGFRPAGEMGFIKPSLRIPDAAFMARPLPGYEPSMTGTLVYPDAFWRQDAVGLR